jgi:hypothetical protein
MKTGLTSLIGGPIFLLFLGFGIGSSVGAPEYALVAVDPDQKLYFAPSCLPLHTLSQITLGAARKLGFEPDAECRDEGGFVQEVRSLSGQFLEKLGILHPLNSRWNSDGSWNW